MTRQLPVDTRPTQAHNRGGGQWEATPYGWRKMGGEMSASNAFRAEGERSAALDAAHPLD